MIFLYIGDGSYTGYLDSFDAEMLQMLGGTNNEASIVMRAGHMNSSGVLKEAVGEGQASILTVSASTPRRLAWETAQAALQGGADGIVCRGWSTCLTMSGNASWKGKLVLALASADMPALLNVTSEESIERVLDACALVIAPQHLHKELLETVRVPPALLVDPDGRPCELVLDRWEGLLGDGTSTWRSLFVFNAARSVTVLLDDTGVSNVSHLDDVTLSHKLKWRHEFGDSSLAVIEGIASAWDVYLFLNKNPATLTKQHKSVAWHLRRFRETWSISLILSNNLSFASYALGHTELSASVVWTGTAKQVRNWLKMDPKMFAPVRERSRHVAVHNENDRHDLELLCPDLSGRVSVLAPNFSHFMSAGFPVSVRYGITPRRLRPGSTRLKVVLASHDFKFCNNLIDVLEARSDVELRFDLWGSQHEGSFEQSLALAEWADVVWVDFASGAAEWYSKNLLAEQRLILRVHGYEVHGPWAEEVNFNRVSKVVFVSEHSRKAGIAKWCLAEDDTVVIPNAVDTLQFSRPKFAGSEYTLGLLGWVPSLKRLDRAIALLERLVQFDSRYRLLIKGEPPRPDSWGLQDERDRVQYAAVFDHIRRNSFLQDHLVFENAAGDVPTWLREVGWILSPSSRESFHLAPMEGMASGSVPVVWDRPGAADVFPSACIVADVGLAADLIREGASLSKYSELTQQSRGWARSFDRDAVAPMWLQVIGINV